MNASWNEQTEPEALAAAETHLRAPDEAQDWPDGSDPYREAIYCLRDAIEALVVPDPEDALRCIAEARARIEAAI